MPAVVAVATLLRGHFTGAYGSANPKRGIVVIQTNGNGVWQYSINHNTWVTLDTVTPTYALLLPPSAWMRFEPATNSSGQADLDFVTWNISQSQSGRLVSTTPGSVTSPFTANAGALAVTVLPVPVGLGVVRRSARDRGKRK
jgi:hypothetical protein